MITSLRICSVFFGISHSYTMVVVICEKLLFCASAIKVTNFCAILMKKKMQFKTKNVQFKMTEDPPGVKEALIKLCLSGFCFVSFLSKFIVSVKAPQSRNQKRGSAVMSAIEVWCRMTLRTVSFF